MGRVKNDYALYTAREYNFVRKGRDCAWGMCAMGTDVMASHVRSVVAGIFDFKVSRHTVVSKLTSGTIAGVGWLTIPH